MRLKRVACRWPSTSRRTWSSPGERWYDVPADVYARSCRRSRRRRHAACSREQARQCAAEVAAAWTAAGKADRVGARTPDEERGRARLAFRGSGLRRVPPAGRGRAPTPRVAGRSSPTAAGLRRTAGGDHRWPRSGLVLGFADPRVARRSSAAAGRGRRSVATPTNPATATVSDRDRRPLRNRRSQATRATPLECQTSRQLAPGDAGPQVEDPATGACGTWDFRQGRAGWGLRARYAVGRREVPGILRGCRRLASPDHGALQRRFRHALSKAVTLMGSEIARHLDGATRLKLDAKLARAAAGGRQRH